jgi:hypothetical protein
LTGSYWRNSIHYTKCVQLSVVYSWSVPTRARGGGLSARLGPAGPLPIFGNFLVIFDIADWGEEKILVFLADFPDFPPFLMLFGALSFLKMA